ncbi:MAG TPA: ATP-binding cassette domain-containing protein [Acidimicrobiia bacterium]|nr:ATP-binding cassette domain-containing protein [Acidimicrobiia bacterium]
MVTSVSSQLGLEASFTVRRSPEFTLDLSMAIPPGRTVALLGPNGAGKSTAVAALAGLIQVDSGRIELGGRTLDDAGQARFLPPEERRVGVVFQDYVLFPHLSVAENIAFGPRSHRMGREPAMERAALWMKRLSLDDLAQRKPGELSGGQAQRVALARALAIEPDLLLLDEPLSALDIVTRALSRRALTEHLAQFPGPRLLITHDPSEAFLLADDIHVIEGGRVTQVGNADEIRLRPRTPYIADLAGSNLLSGIAHDGLVQIGATGLRIADHTLEGPVLITIHPRTISLHRGRPEGSARNLWETSIALIELLGDRARLQVSDPLALTVEVTREAIDDLELDTGARVWLSIKATEIGVEADYPGAYAIS